MGVGVGVGGRGVVWGGGSEEDEMSVDPESDPSNGFVDMRVPPCVEFSSCVQVESGQRCALCGPVGVGVVGDCEGRKMHACVLP